MEYFSSATARESVHAFYTSRNKYELKLDYYYSVPDSELLVVCYSRTYLSPKTFKPLFKLHFQWIDADPSRLSTNPSRQRSVQFKEGLLVL